MSEVKGFNREDFTGFFDNYKFFINPETNELEIKFICIDCKKVMDHDEMLRGRYRIHTSGPGEPLQYHTAIFRCGDCVHKLSTKVEDTANA